MEAAYRSDHPRPLLCVDDNRTQPPLERAETHSFARENDHLDRCGLSACLIQQQQPYIHITTNYFVEDVQVFSTCSSLVTGTDRGNLEKANVLVARRAFLSTTAALPRPQPYLL
ncbi:hypothetical protein IG631_24307 [Alternaria alternata]|nr:hypothetical protein IG631_24307 [Alternaria alternata]